MKIWNIVTPDGELLVWYGRWANRAFGRFPKVGKDGFVWIGGRPYVVDPKRFVKEHYRPKKYFGLVEKEDTYQYWIQNEPDPISFDRTLTPGSINVTSDTIKAFAESEHLARLVSKDTNWYAIIALLAVLAFAGSIIAWYYKP